MFSGLKSFVSLLVVMVSVTKTIAVKPPNPCIGDVYECKRITKPTTVFDVFSNSDDPYHYKLMDLCEKIATREPERLVEQSVILLRNNFADDAKMDYNLLKCFWAAYGPTMFSNAYNELKTRGGIIA